MKIIVVEDGDSFMYFCGYIPDKNSRDNVELPNLCYNKECVSVKRYDSEESMLVDLYRLQKSGINAFSEDLVIGKT